MFCCIVAALLAQVAPEAASYPDGYVDDDACAACHRALAQGYAAVGMGRSFGPFRAAEAIEDFTHNHVYHAPSNRHYEMTLEDGRLLVTRYRVDAGGSRYAIRRQAVDFVIGSGNHSRGYLYRLPGGDMFQMPVAWYSQERRWGMAPGFDHADHEDLDRVVTRPCMFCHNAYPAYAPGSDAFGQPHRFPETLPAGIGCQRCHGPGARHVALATADDSAPAAVRDSIVHPGRLDPALRDDVCLQCHLQPTSRRTSFLRRFGRADYSYLPGTPLADYLVHLDIARPPDADPFEINHHPYRLHRSRCFTASGGRLNCLTCHDPHHVVPAGQRAAHFRARCLGCHAAHDCAAEHGADLAVADCADCHMPKRRTDDVVHVVMTDHHIRRRPPADGLAARAEGPAPPGRAAAYRPATAPAIYARLAEAADVVPGSLERLDAARLDTAPALEIDVQLGLGQLAAGAWDAARSTFTRILATHPRLAAAQLNLGRAHAGAGHPQAALACFRRALILDPHLAEAHYNLGVLHGHRAPQLAEHHYRQALAMRPSYASAALNLGNLLARRGAFDAAAAWFDAAIAADPDRSGAYLNAGAARRHLGRWPEAVTVWQQGLDIEPPDPRLAIELGFAALVRPDRAQRDAGSACRLAERAVALAPGDVEARALRALAWATIGPGPELQQAIDALGPDGRHAELFNALSRKDLPFLARWCEQPAPHDVRWIRAARTLAEELLVDRRAPNDVKSN